METLRIINLTLLESFQTHDTLLKKHQKLISALLKENTLRAVNQDLLDFAEHMFKKFKSEAIIE
jgi:hypothetical protein